MRTPVIVVTGVSDEALESVMVGLPWDLPGAVAVRHRIDPERQVLLRVVSDVTGALDRTETPLEHACVSCAIHEDVLPTLERLARDGSWSSIVACLPTGAEAERLAITVAADTRLARHFRLSSVVTALEGESVVDDLLGADLLRERGRHTGPDDGRGHGEVACAMVEYADLITLTDGADRVARDLVQVLARPDAVIVDGGEHLVVDQLVGSRHDHERATAWTSNLIRAKVPNHMSSRVWRLDLDSPRPFHPGRLLDQIERLGTGRHRSRGCPWLPTRPGVAQVWDGAGGQLSIGYGHPWGRDTPRTRLMITGVGAAPEDLVRAYEELLLGPTEALLEHAIRSIPEDGFESWLGPIRDVA